MAAHPPSTVETQAVDAAHTAAEAARGAAGHGEASGGFPPFEAGLFGTQLFWFAFTFAILYVVVSRFVLPSVGGVLAKRAGAIASDVTAASEKSAEAEAARASMERAMAKARADARAMVEAARADVTAKLTAEQDAAEKRLTDRIAVAEARVDAARQKALAEVPALAEQLARDIADKLAPGQAPRQRAVGDA